MGAYGSKVQNWSPSRLQHSSDDIKRLSNLLKLKSEHQREVAVTGWDKNQREKQNNMMLKGLFKKLDPTVMKPVGDIRGEVQLSFKYEFDNDLLLIKVIKCRDLTNMDVRSKLSSFFVKLELLPDPLGEGDKVTQVVHQTNCPRFDEIFGYKIPEFDLGSSRLVVHVCEQGLGGDHNVRGEVMINLNTFPFRTNPVHTAWYTLNTETDLSVSGELDVSIAFQLPRTLLVTVHGARDLAPRDHGKTADPFVKVAVAGCKKIAQTQVLKNTLEPVWLETLEFSLHEEELENKFIIFHVIDHDTSSSNDSLGQCIVELDNLTADQGISGSFPLSDLKNSDRLRTTVHQNKIAQEFREALIAHSVARAPNCLFKNHSGAKIVTLQCKKAGAQGKVRIVDGIPVY